VELLALVQGDIGEPSTAEEIAATAMSRFESIDVVVNNSGIFFTRRFTDYTERNFQLLSETNLLGSIYITQRADKQMLARNAGGSVACITSAMLEYRIGGVRVSLSMITKGGLEAIA
jgi:NAD(P)-dependent dehydrogenase (short-subunit alcohol dehydrogenase family)